MAQITPLVLVRLDGAERARAGPRRAGLVRRRAAGAGSDGRTSRSGLHGRGRAAVVAERAEQRVAADRASDAAVAAVEVPIPGTKRRRWLEDNLGAERVTLDATELARIDAIAPLGAAAGTRYPEALMGSVNR